MALSRKRNELVEVSLSRDIESQSWCPGLGSLSEYDAVSCVERGVLTDRLPRWSTAPVFLAKHRTVHLTPLLPLIRSQYDRQRLGPECASTRKPDVSVDFYSYRSKSAKCQKRLFKRVRQLIAECRAPSLSAGIGLCRSW